MQISILNLCVLHPRKTNPGDQTFVCLGHLLAYVSGKLLHASRSAYALAATNPKSVETIALLGDVDGQGTRRRDIQHINQHVVDEKEIPRIP